MLSTFIGYTALAAVATFMPEQVATYDCALRTAAVHYPQEHMETERHAIAQTFTELKVTGLRTGVSIEAQYLLESLMPDTGRKVRRDLIANCYREFAQ